ncbi:MAG: HAD-IA family hydrolase [Desulfobacterales bacterium]
MRRIRVVAFDCDGVLFDTLEANRHYYNRILARFGRPPLEEAQLRFAHAHTVHETLALLFEDPAAREAAHAFRRTMDYGDFIAHLAIEPGLKDLLDWMDGRFKKAIATNRTDTMGRLLRAFALEGRFDLVVTSLDVARPKPAPDCLELILERFGAAPQEAVFVGDSAVDEETARAAGVPFIAYRNPALEALHHIESLGQLKNLLEGSRPPNRGGRGNGERKENPA